MKEYTEDQCSCFKKQTFIKNTKEKNAPEYTEWDYVRNLEEFIKDYPVIMSTQLTH